MLNNIVMVMWNGRVKSQLVFELISIQLIQHLGLEDYVSCSDTEREPCTFDQRRFVSFDGYPIIYTTIQNISQQQASLISNKAI
jgi:hypothetical protein